VFRALKTKAQEWLDSPRMAVQSHGQTIEGLSKNSIPFSEEAINLSLKIE